MSKRIVYTPGEPAGIGPDLIIQLAQQPMKHEVVVIADPDMLQQRASELGLALDLRSYEPSTPPRETTARELCCLAQPLAAPCTTGVLQPANAEYVLSTLDRAISGCLTGEFGAYVTGPVHKGIINEAGLPFSGHTEYLAKETGTEQVVMMLASEDLRVALATTHLPLKEVPAAITRESLTGTLRILQRDLQQKYRMQQPRILVCGLNPHAGEDGHMGREEIEVITPTLEELRREGMTLIGPLPADTLFTPGVLSQGDAVLAMYHDQGLPVLKYQGFGSAINITLGLPIIRTSVDHGTALDLAGSGHANCGSLIAAITAATHMAA